ncbi:SRPBCC family protein [Nocardioides terrisoli]|uniref:SRPBCC family protein n=1 Tax=Nocardioides terrisoli TaxID=3388267 RepID=UPI00287B9805|nr:SRPBCC family protein [Nocardioides marmorisolisilvae]
MDLDIKDSFTVPLPQGEAWIALMDLHRIAPCMPGAALDSVEGDDFAGSVRMKIGPILASYRGSGRFRERSESEGRAILEASGRDARAAGTAKATVSMQLEPEGDQTRVLLDMRLSVTGKPAQFGRGVIRDVTSSLLQTFSSNLAAELGRDVVPVDGVGSEAGGGDNSGLGEEPSVPAPDLPGSSSLDLLAVVGKPLLSRCAPVMQVLAALAVVYLIGRRSSHQHRS